jgi:NAD(P)-dependent dehydrogenase (short-subunit alcohol dehydrogenase family)
MNTRQQGLAVVTGGASGIGEAAVRRFAAADYRVLIADVNAERGQAIAQELRKVGAEVDFHTVDVSSEEGVDAFALQVQERHGAPDALVNSGGILQNAVRVLDLDIGEVDRIYDINVRGTVLMSRAFGRMMCEAGHGAIVNLCSLTTFRASAQVGYAISKAGIKTLTELSAAEFGAKGVRVNAVAPGYTLTPAMQARIDSGQRNPQAVYDQSAIARFVQPSEVADAIWFLCSPQAAAITGVTLPVDCGWLVRSAYLAYASKPA